MVISIEDRRCTLPPKRLSATTFVWSKSTRITGSVGGAGAGNPTSFSLGSMLDCIKRAWHNEYQGDKMK